MPKIDMKQNINFQLTNQKVQAAQCFKHLNDFKAFTE